MNLTNFKSQTDARWRRRGAAPLTTEIRRGLRLLTDTATSLRHKPLDPVEERAFRAALEWVATFAAAPLSATASQPREPIGQDP